MRKMDLFYLAICPLWVLTVRAADLTAAPALCCWLFSQSQNPVVNGPGELSLGACFIYNFVTYSCFGTFNEK